MYPNYLVEKFNSYLYTTLKDYKNAPKVLRDAIYYCIKSGGKRFRPVLCMLTAITMNKNFREVFPTACAIEFIHSYSLIHDDLPSIDNDDLRRGKPTCHKVFGEDIAILTGDALFAEAFNIIIKYQDIDPDIKMEIISEIGEASGAKGMVAGQVIDVFYTGKKLSKKQLEIMHNNKTGKLISASIKCAALICRANPKTISKLVSFSKNIGLVFQITDDILDITSDEKILGKAVGKDKILNKNTFPKIWGLEKSKKIARKKVEEAIGMVEEMDINVKPLVDIAKFLIERKA